jgi:hypothetical protein
MQHEFYKLEIKLILLKKNVCKEKLQIYNYLLLINNNETNTSYFTDE